MDPITIGLIMTGLQMGGGLLQGADAKRLAKRNVRGVYDGTSDAENLVNLFQQQAQFGIDQNALTFANEANQNAFSGSVQALLQAGGDPNMISALAGKFTDATEGLALANSDRKWSKINALANATNQLAAGKRDEFLYNVDAPYKDTAQLAAAKQSNAYQQTMMGADFLGSGLINQQRFYGQTGGNKNAATGDSSDQFMQQLMMMMGGAMG